MDFQTVIAAMIFAIAIILFDQYDEKETSPRRLMLRRA